MGSSASSENNLKQSSKNTPVDDMVLSPQNQEQAKDKIEHPLLCYCIKGKLGVIASKLNLHDGGAILASVTLGLISGYFVAHVLTAASKQKQLKDRRNLKL